MGRSCHELSSKANELSFSTNELSFCVLKGRGQASSLPGAESVHLALAGSSRRLMHGLVLDRSAPLFGRAREILRVGPLPAGWIREGLSLRSPVAAIEAFAVWGGVPRYWELAAGQPLSKAVEQLVLSPLGVLHDEPKRLLLDDLSETTQAASILALIGSGCHRMSEIAGRLEKPATSLARPLARLLDLGLVRRDVPFGSTVRNSKRTAYRLDDPFLRFWFRFVDPNRSRLEAGQAARVAGEVAGDLAGHVSSVFEDLVRASVSRTRYSGRTWGPAASWWGPGLDRAPMEIDVVAESEGGSALLVGEVKWSRRVDWKREEATLRRKAANLASGSGSRGLPRLVGSGRAFPGGNAGGGALHRP